MSSTTQPDPRRLLEEMGITYTETSFLQYVALGDSTVVTLFLDAGMRANARTPDGKSALLLATIGNHTDIAQKLLQKGADPLEALEAIHQMASGKKDIWDKLSALTSSATIFSSLTIAIVGGWFTYSYNKRQIEQQTLQATRDSVLKEQQNRVAELDTMQKFVPYLTKDEDSKCVALLAINTLARPELATKMASLYQGRGSVCALEKIATSGDQQAKQQAVSALSSIASSTSAADKSQALGALSGIFENYRAGVVRVSAKTDQGELESSGLVVTNSGLVLIPDYVAGASFAGQSMPKPRDFEVETFDGTKYAAVLLDVNPTYKLGILQFKAPRLLPITLSTVPSRAGARVIMVGFFQSTPSERPALRATVGTVTSIDSTFVNVAANGRVEGGGGGPILNDKGEALGILHSGKPDLLLFVRADIAASYLKSKGLL